MARIFNLVEENNVFGATHYPSSNAEAAAMGLSGGKNEEVRALTIAAFRVAQNDTGLSPRIMDAALLLHLLADSETALNYWVAKSRLSQSSSGYVLTPEGLSECENSLSGLTGAYNTTEEKVQEWVNRFLSGDQVVNRVRVFSQNAWSSS